MGDTEPGFPGWKSWVWPLLSAVFLSMLLSPLPQPLFSTFPVFSPHLLNCKPMTSQQRVWSVATTLPGATLQCCRNNNNTATDTSVLGLRLQLCVLLGHIQRSSVIQIWIYIHSQLITLLHMLSHKHESSTIASYLVGLPLDQWLSSCGVAPLGGPIRTTAGRGREWLLEKYGVMLSSIKMTSVGLK